MSEIIEEGQTTVKQQGVDRGRRYWFISRVTAFCLTSTLLLAILNGMGLLTNGPLIELYVRSVLTLALTAVMAYLTGSVVDYNGGFGNLFSRRDTPPQPHYEDDGPRG